METNYSPDQIMDAFGIVLDVLKKQEKGGTVRDFRIVHNETKKRPKLTDFERARSRVLALLKKASKPVNKRYLYMYSGSQMPSSLIKDALKDLCIKGEVKCFWRDQEIDVESVGVDIRGLFFRL